MGQFCKGARVDIPPIKNDGDHVAALEEIKSLWTAAEGSLEYDRLAAMVTLVDDFEKQRWPIGRD